MAGKSDMERVGLFQEMGYVTIGDKYKAADPGLEFNSQAAKGKQMLPGGSKTRAALQAGYFQDKFTRVFESEAHSDAIKIRRQGRLKEAQKNIGKAFLPSNGEKRPSGLGSHYGTFGGPIKALDPGSKSGRKYAAPGKNILTNPGKKGTGFGYVGVTISSYPNYKGDPYDRSRELTKKENQGHRGAMKGSAFRLNMHPKAFFDINPYASDKPLPPVKSKSAGNLKGDVKPFKPSSPGKLPGGMKAGTFDPYPNHSVDPFQKKVHRPINVVNKSGKIFIPSQGPKSTPTNSIIDQNVVRTINIQNYRSQTIC